MIALPSAVLIAGRGIDGDRYFYGVGTYSQRPGPSRQVTLFEIEVLEQVKFEYGVTLRAEESRRNIVTQGVPLNHLVGREFRVGSVVLRGSALCEPCAHLDRLLGGRGALKPLVHRGGLRADILEGGTVKLSDSIVF
jgi:MOSC domain-containing protein YiiM